MGGLQHAVDTATSAPTTTRLWVFVPLTALQAPLEGPATLTQSNEDFAGVPGTRLVLSKCRWSERKY